MQADALTTALKEEALRLGFVLAGACPAVESPDRERFQAWLDAGYAGQMTYLGRDAAAREHPRSILDGVRSLLMLAVGYRTQEPPALQAGQGRVSRYAWGADYHDVLRDRLHRLADFHRQLTPSAGVRGVVDTAPLMERQFAQLAGLGWLGKNTLLLNRRYGSWLFLAALLTTEELVCDAPFEADHCGTCRACLDACPTGALVEPHVLDARRCISYLTIELRDAIPEELRSRQSDWLFGCDVCQDVCPWNARVATSGETAFEPLADRSAVDLAELLSLDDAAFARRFRHAPLLRPKRAGLLRNAAIVLGNRPDRRALPALQRGLEDAEPQVRAACAWALRQYGLSKTGQV